MLIPIVFFCLLSTILCQSDPCGTPTTDSIIPPKLYPEKKFVLNAPFDLGVFDFFQIENVSDRKMFFYADYEPRRFPTPFIELFYHRNVLKTHGKHKKESIGVDVDPFEYNEKLSSSNISLIITYGNVPLDHRLDESKPRFCESWIKNTKTITLPVEFNF